MLQRGRNVWCPHKQGLVAAHTALLGEGVLPMPCSWGQSLGQSSLPCGVLPVCLGPEFFSPDPIGLAPGSVPCIPPERLCTVCPHNHEDGARGMQAARRVSPSCPPPRCKDREPRQGHMNTAHEPWRRLVTAMSRGCGRVGEVNVRAMESRGG